MRTREEHIKFCKESAYKQYEFDKSGNQYSDPKNAYVNACTTMLCDMAKHPETQRASEACALLIFTVMDEESMRRFIDGFN